MPNAAPTKWASVKGFRAKLPKLLQRFYGEILPLAIGFEEDVHPHSAFVRFRMEISRERMSDLDVLFEENGFKCEGHYIDPDTEESVEAYSQDKSAVWQVSIVDFRYIEFVEVI